MQVPENDLLAGIERGDLSVIARFQEEYRPFVISVLMKRGATPTEAEDLAEDLLGDCLHGRNGRAPLLRKFQLRSSPKAWLATVATNRLIDLKRRQRFVQDVEGEMDQKAFVQRSASKACDNELDGELATLLRSALEEALADCAVEDRLMLSLVYIEGVSQRKVARMWGWHESKVSRTLTQTMERIANHTIDHIRSKDPWLHLTWQDFVAMCAVMGTDFL